MSDGGPAFPETLAVIKDGDRGMTLRDYFAAKALAGYLAYPKRTCDMQVIANSSFLMADAMLAEREKGMTP